MLVNIWCSCVGLRAGEMEANNACEFGRLDYKDPSLNYSAAVSSCFKEAGGKLAVFTANIVERFSHPNKIEAQERKKGGWGWGGGSIHPKLQSSTGARAGTVRCKLFRWLGGRRRLEAPAVDGALAGRAQS